jgi:uncharacterized alpha/beta hydrolase family protein
MKMDDIIKSIDNLSITTTLTPTNLEKTIPKLQKLQTLLQKYQEVKRMEEALTEYNKQKKGTKNCSMR